MRAGPGTGAAEFDIDFAPVDISATEVQYLEVISTCQNLSKSHPNGW
jgi:hypothetical protein